MIAVLKEIGIKTSPCPTLFGAPTMTPSLAKNDLVFLSRQPDWYQKPSDINNLFEAMCVNNINENIAEKIIGTNWLNFMKNHF